MQGAPPFLGVRLCPPTPDWGASIGNAVAWSQTDPADLIVPGAALFLATLAFNLLGDGLRGVLDPGQEARAVRGRPAASRVLHNGRVVAGAAAISPAA